MPQTNWSSLNKKIQKETSPFPCNTLGKGCFFLSFLFFINFSYSQNLVPNSSFEDTISFNNWLSIGQPDFGMIPPWFCAGGSPDYWSESWGGFSQVPDVPNAGFQYPHSGIAFIGIGVYWSGGTFYEYIETPLIHPLVGGKKYCVSFYVSLGNTSMFAIDAIGAYFSNDSIMSPPPIQAGFTIKVTPQIENSRGNYINDTSNWVEISGVFIASGGESFLTIGNFRVDSLTDTLHVKVDSALFSQNVAYYFIDDVSVVAIKEDSANAGKDTTICKGQSCLLGSAAVSGFAYYWSPSLGLDDSTKAQPLASPTIRITYVLRVIDTSYAPSCRGSVTAIDSVTITVRDCTLPPKPPSVFTNKLYPNLNNGTFTLEYNLQNTGVFSLYDVLGQLVLRQYIIGEQGTQQIYASSLSNGIYFWEVISGNDIPVKGKIVIMK